jgi:hypothetical protein
VLWNLLKEEGGPFCNVIQAAAAAIVGRRHHRPRPFPPVFVSGSYRQQKYLIIFLVIFRFKEVSKYN